MFRKLLANINLHFTHDLDRHRMDLGWLTPRAEHLNPSFISKG